MPFRGGIAVSRIFISHSSTDNAAAIALRDWLVTEGWSELFLDLDPERGIAAGERWERALNEAARRCEAVLFLVSRAWLSSPWCKNELNLARRLNKRLFGVLIEEGLAIGDLPTDVTSKWQVINLAAGSDHRQFPVTLPVTGHTDVLAGGPRTAEERIAARRIGIEVHNVPSLAELHFANERLTAHELRLRAARTAAIELASEAIASLSPKIERPLVNAFVQELTSTLTRGALRDVVPTAV